MASILRGTLHAASWRYRLGVGLRNWAYDRGIFRRYSPPVACVISVGNIVAGGTGKTPIVQLLAQELAQHASVAILSRGYRSPAEKAAIPMVLSRGEGPLHPAAIGGDEPYLLAANIPTARVYVGRNRRKGAVIASQHGAQIIVLDDGMQHRQIVRDIEIAVVDGEDLWGSGHFLPRGLLRESPSALKRADMIVVNHVKDSSHYRLISEHLSPYTQAPIVGVRPKAVEISGLGGEIKEDLQGLRVGLFCGIAKPDRFRSLVQELGGVIVNEWAAPDHLLPSQDHLERFAVDCEKAGAKYLLCTEKDRVKLSLGAIGSLPILCVKMRLQIIEGTEAWKAMVSRVINKLGNQA